METQVQNERTRGRCFLKLVRGQAAVEFALVVPVLVVLLMIVGEFLRVYYTTIELNNAARAGVQYGLHSPANAANLTGMQQAALNDGSDISGMTAVATEYCQCSDGSSVSCGTAGACADERVYIEVDTAATFYTLANWPGIPKSIALSGKAIMREQ
jgi:Flp pilus assembly protein TadG